uniref:Uncharacterized protein n=1 Tax=Megaselia scalaris TaxID=36166 RepID=T1GWH7_MEGSC
IYSIYSSLEYNHQNTPEPVPSDVFDPSVNTEIYHGIKDPIFANRLTALFNSFFPAKLLVQNYTQVLGCKELVVWWTSLTFIKLSFRTMRAVSSKTLFEKHSIYVTK